MKNINENNSFSAFEEKAEQAVATLKQLANTKRLMLLCHLSQHESTVGGLVELVGLSQSAVSQHLAKMRESGLIASDKRGKLVYYRVANPEVNAILSTLYLIYCR